MADNMGRFTYPGWFHKVEEPRFGGSGKFTAWIAASLWSPSPGSSGVSAAAWLVVRDDNSEQPVRESRPSEAFDSDDYRATVAAALRAVQTVPHRSHLLLRTVNKVVAEAIERNMYRWENEGWKARGGKRNGWEFYEALITLIKDRSLTVHVEYKRTDDSEIVALRRLAHQYARRAGELMGIPPGSRLSFRKGQPMTVVNMTSAALEGSSQCN
jgi:hypothetical protein